MSDYVKPAALVQNLIDGAVVKSALPPRDLLIRGALSGAILGFATTLAVMAAVQTGQYLIGSLIFPAGFAIVVILGLELLTGSFGVIPLAVASRRASAGQMLRNWFWVFLGNLIGALVYAGLFWVSLTGAGHDYAGPLAERLRSIAEHKTIAYQAQGLAGMVTVFVRALLCNWMVCLAVVMGAASTSTAGKILACWLPIVVFFAQGFEHSVVNMFAIPIGMMLGAHVSFAQWWLWNEIPVTLGNLVGGFVFTGLALFLTYGDADQRASAPRQAQP